MYANNSVGSFSNNNNKMIPQNEKNASFVIAQVSFKEITGKGVKFCGLIGAQWQSFSLTVGIGHDWWIPVCGFRGFERNKN